MSKDDGNHKLLGSSVTTIAALSGGQRQLKMGSRVVNVTKFELKPVVNFLEYIFGGCKINLSVAIDFTASNGYVDDPSSLHSRNEQRNQYL